MTDINTELERIADETLGNPLEEAQGNLDTKGDPRAAMKGALAAQKEAKIAGGTPGGETQDMGPADVSPEAKSDPGSAATKKAKKATPPTTKSSVASSAPMGDGSGEMKVGAREELELEGVDPEQQLHEVVVGRRAGRLDHEYVLAADVLEDLDLHLAIGEPGDRCLAEGNLHVVGNFAS